MSDFSEYIESIRNFSSAAVIDTDCGKLYLSKGLAETLGYDQIEICSLYERCDSLTTGDALLGWCRSQTAYPFNLTFFADDQSAKTYQLQKQNYREPYCIVTCMAVEEDSPAGIAVIDEQLYDVIPCGLFRIALDEDMTILYKNSFFDKTFHYNTADGLRNVRQLLPQDKFEMMHKAVLRQKDDGSECFEIENRCVCHDGEIIWVLNRYKLMNGVMYGAVFDVTERKEMREKLRISEQEYRIAMRLSKHTLMRYHIPSSTLYLEDPDQMGDNEVKVIHNVPENAMKKDLVAKESLHDYYTFYQNMIKGVPQGETSIRIRLGECEPYSWVKANYALTYDDSNHPITSVISYQECTKEHDQQIAYQRWTQAFEKKKKDAVAYYEYDITNDRLERMEAKSSPKLFERQTTFTHVAAFIAEHYVYPDDKQLYLSIFNREYFLSCYYQNQYELSCEHRRMNAEGTVFWACGEIQLIADPFADTIKAFVMIQDIDKDKKKELQLRKELESDPLTGLLNRRSVELKADQIMSMNRNRKHALIMLDMDYFKLLNDELGHLTGDETLCMIADTLCKQLREQDLCARMGGDEFILFLQDIKDAASLRKKLEKLNQVLHMKVKDIHLSASFGVSVYPEDGMNFRTLYEKADHAMYEAKRKGKSTYHICGE